MTKHEAILFLIQMLEDTRKAEARARQMLEEAAQSIGHEKGLRAQWKGAADRLQAQLDAAEARIAELQARPAAPSVEDVAEALVNVEACYATHEQTLQRLCGVSATDAGVAILRAWDDHRAKRRTEGEAS